MCLLLTVSVRANLYLLFVAENNAAQAKHPAEEIEVAKIG
jgi:hypothetical protein